MRMKKVQCGMCDTVFEVPEPEFDRIMSLRNKRNKRRIDNFYCPKHLPVALDRYGE